MSFLKTSALTRVKKSTRVGKKFTRFNNKNILMELQMENVIDLFDQTLFNSDFKFRF